MWPEQIVLPVINGSHPETTTNKPSNRTGNAFAPDHVITTEHLTPMAKTKINSRMQDINQTESQDSLLGKKRASVNDKNQKDRSSVRQSFEQKSAAGGSNEDIGNVLNHEPTVSYGNQIFARLGTLIQKSTEKIKTNKDTNSAIAKAIAPT